MTFVSPMLAKTATRESLGNGKWGGYYLEAKHDGMRAIVSIQDDGVEIYSRTGKRYAQHVPHLVEEFANLPSGTILDGELAIIESSYRVQGKLIPIVAFNDTMRVMGSKPERAIRLQNERKKVSFLAFDILSWNGVDLASQTQIVRSSALEDRFKDHAGDPSSRIWLNPQFWIEEDFGMLYDVFVEAGIEGVIMKNRAAVYAPGKRLNKGWYKVKSEKTFDVVVMGFTEANEGKTGKFAGQIGAVKFGAWDADGKLQYVGRCSGMNDAEREFWTTCRDSHEGEFGFGERGWVIEVKCNELVGSGEFRTPRHPQYVTKRIDKASADCTMEQFRA